MAEEQRVSQGAEAVIRLRVHGKFHSYLYSINQSFLKSVEKKKAINFRLITNAFIC